MAGGLKPYLRSVRNVYNNDDKFRVGVDGGNFVFRTINNGDSVTNLADSPCAIFKLQPSQAGANDAQQTIHF